MSEKEIDEFLKNGRMLKIASIGDNKPHVTPIWYVYQNGKFYVSTSSKTRKVKNLKRNKNVAFSLDVGESFADVKAVVGSGTAQIVTDPKLRAMWMRKSKSNTLVAQIIQLRKNSQNLMIRS